MVRSEVASLCVWFTNVYTAGATAFFLFAGSERTVDYWQLCDKLFAVAAKAVNDDRLARQQSVRQFREEWEAALKRFGMMKGDGYGKVEVY